MLNATHANSIVLTIGSLIYNICTANYNFTSLVTGLQLNELYNSYYKYFENTYKTIIYPYGLSICSLS